MPSTGFPYFPIGAVHHADYLKQSPPMEPDEYREFMRREIGAMRDLGLTTYDMNFAWFDLEVAPGRFDWRRTDAVYELCEEFGLGVFAWIFAELTPRWLVKEHPETAAIAATGYSGPSHSYGHPLVRERMKQYINAVVERYGGARILAYNVGVESGLFWNEEQDSSEPAARLWDYNPEVIAGLAGWLERKYGTIAELNRIYRDHYSSFAEVQPPNSRFIQEQFMLINQVPWLDWRLYMCDLLSGYIHFKAECVRTASPGATVAEQSYVIDPAMNAQDIWRTNSKMDAVGTSMFISGSQDEHIAGSYWHDYFRSSAKGKPYWIWELRCGQNAWGLTNWGPPLTAEIAGRLTWQAIAHEVKSIQYWNWRPHIGGIEVGGHAMTTRDGRLTPRAERIGDIARALNADHEWYASLRLAQADIAILDPKLPRIVATGEGSDAYVMSSQIGAYSALRTLGLRVDFLHEDEVAAGDLASYRLLVLPFAYAMEQRTATAIAAWVQGGGTVLAGIWPGAKDGHGYGQPHNPGLGLHELFGADEYELLPVRADNQAIRSSMSMSFGDAAQGRPAISVIAAVPGTAGGCVGQTFRGFAYLSRLTPAAGTTVIAVDGAGCPVVTHAQYGTGRALLVGSFPVRPDPFQTDGYTALLANLCQAAGITAPASVVSPVGSAVEAEVLHGDDGRALLVVLNASEDETSVTIRLALPVHSARDVESGQEVEAAAGPHDCDIAITMAAGDGRAFELIGA